MATTIVSVRLTSETKEALDLLAREMDRPRAQLAACAITEYVQRNTWQLAAIKEGIAQLDAGLSHDFDEVTAEITALIAEKNGVSAD
jgi:predicted transcriptional regulator